MSLTTSEMTPADIAAVTGNGSGNAWGGDGAWWIIILFLFCLMGNGGAWGNGGPAAPFIANSATQGDVQRGFDQSALMGGINGINATLNANQAGLMAQLNTMAYNQLGSASQQLASNADLKYTIATEASASRNSVEMALQQMQASQTAQTQAILDKLCQQEIDQKNDTISQLRQQISLASLAASQNQQTGQLMADNAAQTQSLVNQLRTPSPVPAYLVQNPNGCNCGIGYGCCGAA